MRFHSNHVTVHHEMQTTCSCLCNLCGHTEVDTAGLAPFLQEWTSSLAGSYYGEVADQSMYS